MPGIASSLSRILNTLCIAMLFVPVTAWAVTPNGTQINACAQAGDTDANGAFVPSVSSNTAVVSVEYPSELSVGAAKEYSDGQFVQLSSAIVVAGTPELGNTFYIEADDRSAGIRVQTGQAVEEGDIAVVSGTLDTSDGERRIAAVDVTVLSSDNPLPKALFLTPGHSIGLDSSGLLTVIAGRISDAPTGAGYFLLDNGAYVDDSGPVGIRVYGTAPSHPVGKHVVVTGIRAVELSGGLPTPVLRTRRAGDISVISSLPQTL